MTGVTTTSSSLSLFLQVELEKRSPMMGRSLMIGIPVFMRSCSLLKSPEMIMLWSRRTSTVVETRRVRNAGTLNPESSIPEAKSRLDTSGITLSLTRLSLRISATKRSRTPNSLYWMVTRVVPASPGCTTGIGSSPPARKVAVSLFPASRLGSARVFAFPSDSCRSSSARRCLVPKSVRTVRNPASGRVMFPLLSKTLSVPNVPVPTRVPRFR